MAQIKKNEVRSKILEAAEALFVERGYVDTTMTAIAGTADISKSNIYVYFPSKLDILWAISAPWLRQHFDALEQDIHAISDPKEKIRYLFRALWCRIPADRKNFANNMMQALSTTSRSDGYSRELLMMCETRFAEFLADALGTPVSNMRAAAHIALMAFDGYAIGHNLGVDETSATTASDAMADLLLKRYG